MCAGIGRACRVLRVRGAKTHDFVRAGLVVVVDDASEKVVRDPDEVLRSRADLGPDILDSPSTGRVRDKLVPPVRLEERTPSQPDSSKLFLVRRLVGREPRAGASLVRLPDQERRREIDGEEREHDSFQLELGGSEMDRTERVLGAGVGQAGGSAAGRNGGIARRADDFWVQRVDGLGCRRRGRIRSIDRSRVLEELLFCVRCYAQFPAPDRALCSPANCEVGRDSDRSPLLNPQAAWALPAMTMHAAAVPVAYP